ncbi:phage tail length tape measure family protein [Paracoccus kondratievae]
MSDFANLIMTVDASSLKQGEQALDSLATKGAQAEKIVTKGLRNVGDSGKQAGRGLSEAEAAAKRTAAGFDQAAQQARRAANETRAAAGHTGNLVSQFNDIAVMMAAGQSPIQLALQQGTQITQVLTTMGGGVGAVKALGGAFLSMINPMSLATIGVIAFGSAAVQWLTSSGEAAEDFEDAFDRLDGVISGLKGSIRTLTNSDLEELRAKYGEINAELLTHIERLNEIAKRDAMRETALAIGAIRESLTGGWITTDVDDIREMFGTTNDNARELLRLMEDIEKANTVEGRAEAVQALRSHIEETTTAWMNAESAAGSNYDEIVKMDDKLRQIVHQMQKMPDAAKGTTLEVQIQNRELERALEYGGMVRQMWEDRATFVEEEVEKLSQQAEMNRLVAQFGADSYAVTVARVQAERDAYAEMVATTVGANELADALMAAWDLANGVASVDMEGNIALATNETWTWADAMAGVRAEIGAIASALASMGGEPSPMRPSLLN